MKEAKLFEEAPPLSCTKITLRFKNKTTTTKKLDDCTA